MKTVIPCKITYSKSDKCWYVESPEFYDGYITYGNSLEEAKAMAVEAVSGLLESYLEHGDKFSVPKSVTARGWYNIEKVTQGSLRTEGSYRKHVVSFDRSTL